MDSHEIASGVQSPERRLLVSFQALTAVSPGFFMDRIQGILQQNGLTRLHHLAVRRLETITLLALQPHVGIALPIRENSAIVGRYTDCGELQVSFEGNLHGGMPSMEERYFQAATRMLERYPTVAQGIFPRSFFKVIGIYSLREDYAQPKLHLFSDC